VSARLDDRGQWTDIIVYPGPAGGQPQFLTGLTEHDVRDLEFALAQRRAMGKCCPGVSGIHVCSMPPDHGSEPGHLCRACDEIWPAGEAP
jgi:hypothetical protein